MIAWYVAVVVNSPASFEAFLAQYPSSDLAPTAMRLLERARNRSLMAGAGADATGEPRSIGADMRLFAGETGQPSRQRAAASAYYSPPPPAVQVVPVPMRPRPYVPPPRVMYPPPRTTYPPRPYPPRPNYPQRGHLSDQYAIARFPGNRIEAFAERMETRDPAKKSCIRILSPWIPDHRSHALARPGRERASVGIA